jgi:hypothetical protein
MHSSSPTHTERLLENRTMSEQESSDMEDDIASEVGSADETKYRSRASKCCDLVLHDIFLAISDDSGDVGQIVKWLSMVLALGVLLGSFLPHNQDLNGIGYQYFSSIIGYTYFIAWSVSFYPQPFLNYRRKNTEGM